MGRRRIGQPFYPVSPLQKDQERPTEKVNVSIALSAVPYELRESELVSRFPAETAELLIYLSNCTVGYHAADLATIDARLPPIDPQVRRRVDEAFAHAGVPRPPN